MKYIGYIGLGKMGVNMALHLKEQGYGVVAFNRGEEGRKSARKKGLRILDSLEELIGALPAPRVLWVMISHAGMDEMLRKLSSLLSRGDIIVDGGNCFYQDTIRRAKMLKRKGISMLDAGVSGGPYGARTGACVMVGGDKKTFKKLTPLFKSISAPEALSYVGSHGAGHFVKMVHNGIEYGMMQALAEGFEVLRASPFKLGLQEVARLYNHKSVIESRLVGWLQSAFKVYGQELKTASPSVAHTGEGEWTVKTARALGVPVKIIEGSLKIRKNSAKNPRFSGKVLSALRNQFGGHTI
ncbi:MAG: 6-phosphogluconate dehydrogenase (decarboxylating) [Candidatus Taylorbacteria bacterium RIFCSPHIGHO2_02_FULL_46_13]|uniref:6-phosphogluconate dehydrogenase (Decarboxylating) n=1 Tax=Candidatus Taylorbacteria bacterium RIFCSPHIGHO2_02_FULL_46_13 TaxID=1802312 RepID=A0A1G2MTG7_9BACT|nr:MAG: 6-phosphogluconate dehydrogenase (decarboxylating) [Candidatus Taylorbacteria bacterium RIFCSPHIGHO2_02_FULL_46_13]